MRKTSVDELLQKTAGQLLFQASGVGTDLSGIGTDTRKDLSGQVFWVLKGENFDAHEFLDKAVAQGARALLVERAPTPEQLRAWNVHVIQVADTLKALQNFAREVRRSLKAKVIGITGSNGKTSTKEFLASVLKPEVRVHWNPGSFNNHFGLPFNLLQTPVDAEVLIAEMGMNHAGELTELCHIAEPDIVVCTMVGTAHIEHFGTTEKIAEAKEEIYLAAPAKAVRVFNVDNVWTRKMAEKARTEFPVAKILQFSNREEMLAQPQIDVALVKDLGVAGSAGWGLALRGRIGDLHGRVETSLLGDHNVVNLAAAAAIALALGLQPAVIWRNLALCKAHWGRMQLLKAEKGTNILFDGYNANPESMDAMLESLKTSAIERLHAGGKKFAVLAEMRELGTTAEQAHFELGQKAGAAGLAGIYFYGPSATDFERGVRASGSLLEAGKNLIISSAYEERLALQLTSMLDPKDLVAVKASRGMKSEQFVLLLKPADFYLKA
jgi:UDP-N-acetylmuramoyl-tripeptide--D-alanyl-D-alanine ligase